MTRDQLESELWGILLGRPRRRRPSRLLARQIAGILAAADLYASAEARARSERLGLLEKAIRGRAA